MRRNLAGLIVVLTVVSTPSQIHTQAQDDVAKQLIGVWRLVSRPQVLADGTPRESPVSDGYIIYTDTNRMCAVIVDPKRPKWAEASSPTAAEALSSINGLNAYCGRVEVHAKEGFVLHYVELEKSPNKVGSIRKRWFKFDGPNRITLRSDTSEIPGVAEGSLIWERVQK